jgi:hypothetical protein
MRVSGPAAGRGARRPPRGADDNQGASHANEWLAAGRNHVKKGSLLAILAGAIGLVALFAVLPNMLRPADGQAQGAAIPRLQGTQFPSISGVWQALNEANWDLEPHAMKIAWTTHPGVPSGGPVPNAPVLAWGATAAVPGSLGVVVGGEIPYKPEALERKKDNHAHAIERDPEVKCLLPGVPRATYLPYPFQVTQSHTKVMIQYGFSNAGRTIHLDEVDDPGIESWMGHSVGKWEGDTLVVTVTNLNGDTWFDRAGNHHSAEMKVTERYTPTSPHHITYEATIDDPATFTKPWTIRMPLYKRIEEFATVFELRCVEMVEELVYGHLRKEQLVKYWEADYGRRGGTLSLTVGRKASKIEE